MATSSQTQTSPQVMPLHQSPQAWMDRDGDTWVAGDRTPRGDLLVSCPQPSSPEDAGDGESFAWTLRLVEAGFGPLKAVAL